MGDQSLGVPGNDLPGSHSATEFVAWYNGHPDFSARTLDLSSERAVLVGNGNVALDVARILVADPEALARTDITDHAGLPFDEVLGTIPNDGGRVRDTNGEPGPGLYLAGWIERGPTGVIGTDKQCARETIGTLFEDFTVGALTPPVVKEDDLPMFLPGSINLRGWRQIDQAERSRGKEQRRPRVKLVDRADLLATVRDARC